MPTENEKKTIQLIHENPDISLRKIVAELDLGGVASASHIINSLERKGYVRRVGEATSKKYQLTEKSLAFFEVMIDQGAHYSAPFEGRTPISTFSVMTSPIDSQSASVKGAEEFPEYLPRTFTADGTDGIETTGESYRKIVSATFTRLINSPTGIERYGDAIVLVIVLTAVILPLCHFVLKEQWLIAFTPIALLAVSIIPNRK